MTTIASMRDNSINELAFEWLVRADGGLSPSEQAQLDAWLASDSKHYGAYIRAKAVFSQAGRAKAFAHSPNPDEWLQNISADQIDIKNGITRADNDEAQLASVSRRAFLGVASGVAVAGLAFAFLATGQPAQAVTFRTKVGEMRDIALEDGTAVALNTDSEIRVLFGNKLRTVELIRGEVLFDVAHESDRPFVVYALGFQARAVGTSFAIQQIQGMVPRVIVRNGVVDIIPAAATPLRVTANTRITVLSGGRVSRKMLSQTELDRELIWREGKIAFDETPLRNAVSAFDRYGSTHIEVEDPELLNYTVSGVFSSDDPMGFAKVVAEVFDIEVIPDGRGVILRRKG